MRGSGTALLQCHPVQTAGKQATKNGWQRQRSSPGNLSEGQRTGQQETHPRIGVRTKDVTPTLVGLSRQSAMQGWWWPAPKGQTTTTDDTDAHGYGWRWPTPSISVCIR